MRRRSFLGSTAALSGLGVLAACAPGSDDGDGAGPGPGADEVETDIAALGDITLTMWDQEVRGAQNDAIEALIERSEERRVGKECGCGRSRVHHETSTSTG